MKDQAPMAAFPERAPQARTSHLVTTDAGAEVLVYDRLTHHIHHLNATSAMVWRLCDGRRSVTEIALSAGMTEPVVRVALAKLADADLLDGALSSELRGPARSRRAFMKQAA